MRIVQLIDSLQMGGAEKMAVQYANALAGHVAFSGLVATRREGPLKATIDRGVTYVFLNKKGKFDWRALWQLRTYCKKHHIGYIHAHGTSFFTATLAKCLMPRLKIIWHDHHGNRSNQSVAQNRMLWLCARFFDRVIAVNHELLAWSKGSLGVRRAIYLPNFIVASPAIGTTILSGMPGKRILCLANLRHPKNHLLLLEVARHLRTTHPDWTLHLVGEDRADGYSDALKAFITQHQLHESVYLYGLRTDTAHIIAQTEIAVIASTYEGLPVALLEYGIYEKAVVCTAVGQIPSIVQDGVNGLLVRPDWEPFYQALHRLIGNRDMRVALGSALKDTISGQYSEKAVIQQYLQWIECDDK